jgi:hypothetical protein
MEENCMRIFDINDNEVKTPDLTKGRLKPDKILVAHHEAVEAVKEKGHYEVVAEYPETGGKDFEWVVDVAGTEAKDAWDEYEDVYRYVLFTAKELAERKITELKKMLLDTDYHILKVVEGATTLAACTEVMKKRAEWRKEINELEKQL